MSSSSDSPRRLSQHNLPEQVDRAKQPEVRRSSKYDIYGTATKPFGESYRKSLILQQSQEEEHDQDSGHGKEREDSSVDTDSVEETMGCSTSRAEVALNEETIKGSFVNKVAKGKKQVTSSVRINSEIIKNGSNGTNVETYVKNGLEKNNLNNNNEYNKLKTERISDFEIIYGSDDKTHINNNGYSTIDIYSEVKKPIKTEKDSNQIQGNNQTPREKLMQQIRDRKDETKEQQENAYSTITRIEKRKSDEHKAENSTETEEINHITCDDTRENKITNETAIATPVSFVEEEYSYEPDKKEATSKLVVRSRSLLSLEQNLPNYNTMPNCTLTRPNTLKMTTKSNGAISYGLQQGTPDSELLKGDTDKSYSPESEVKSNYVSNIKNAFDAAIENRNQNKIGKAEAFDGLRQYFHDNKHGLQELLINNNVVIIEPFRPEPPKSPSEKSDSGSQRTCRITGATIKSPVSDQSKIIKTANTLPRRSMKSCQNTRQGFYHPIKVNKELIDAELPDPDKVKSARELFEKVFKSKSSTEHKEKKTPSKSFFNTITSKMRITPEVKIIKEGKQTMNEKRKPGRFLFDQIIREDVKRHPIQRRWTDSGSLSSGVSSDFSCDQDCEFHHNESSQSGSNHDILEEYTSDEDDAEYIYPYDDDDRHPVSSEVLQKIRACGTTVTYYGGKVIERSHGQFRSPMTMTIMDEIRQNGGTSEGRKKFEMASQEPYLGVKFRLVKSHSCGSRLEIAGTEEESGTKLLSPKHDNIPESIAEEATEVKEETITHLKTEENSPLTSMEEEEDKVEADRYVDNTDVHSLKNPQVMTWAELKLKEARKQWHCAPEAVRLPPQDMEFETFEVLDESKPHKAEKNETGGPTA